MAPQDLSTLSSFEFRNFLNSFDTVLCDCDGVIWCLNQPLAGVKETIAKLKQCGKSVHFVTNNSSIGIQSMLNAVKQFDDFNENDVITPAQAIMSYLQEKQFNKEIYLLGTSNMKLDFENAGFTCANTSVDESADFYLSMKELIKDNEKIGAVIWDYDIHASMAKLIQSTIFLQRPDVLYISGASDQKLSVGQNTMLPGPYYFLKALIDVTNRMPIEFGKPSLNLHKYIVKRFNIKNPSRVLFVGDSMPQDVGFGTTSGYQTLLVFTGVTKYEDMEKNLNEIESPNYYLNSFSELCGTIKNKLNL